MTNTLIGEHLAEVSLDGKPVLIDAGDVLAPFKYPA